MSKVSIPPIPVSLPLAASKACSATLPPKVHKKFQFIGRLSSEGDFRLSSEGDTAAESLWLCSVMLGWIQNTQEQDTTTFWWQCKLSLVIEPDWVSVFSRGQTASMSLHQSFYVDPLPLKGLIRTAPINEGGRSTKTEVITRAWHEGPQQLKVKLLILLCSNGWDWQLMMLWRSILILDHWTGLQTALSVITYSSVNFAGTCSSCSVHQEVLLYGPSPNWDYNSTNSW